MTAGYIYILSNVAMPGLLKIGRTDRQPELRARELRTTGVPQPFHLEHYVSVFDSAQAENQVHNFLQRAGVRLSPDREFFVVSLNDAVQALDLLSTDAQHTPDFTRSKELSRLAATIQVPPQSSSFEDYEKAAIRLAEVARRGYPNAMMEAAIIFEYNSPSGSHFKQFWREYLSLAKCEAACHAIGSSVSRERCKLVGKAIAEYLYHCHKHRWLIDEDFKYVSSLLIEGNSFQYEGYINEVRRYAFPEPFLSKACDV